MIPGKYNYTVIQVDGLFVLVDHYIITNMHWNALETCKFFPQVRYLSNNEYPQPIWALLICLFRGVPTQGTPENLFVE